MDWRLEAGDWLKMRHDLGLELGEGRRKWWHWWLGMGLEMESGLESGKAERMGYSLLHGTPQMVDSLHLRSGFWVVQVVCKDVVGVVQVVF